MPSTELEAARQRAKAYMNGLRVNKVRCPVCTRGFLALEEDQFVLPKLRFRVYCVNCGKDDRDFYRYMYEDFDNYEKFHATSRHRRGKPRGRYE